MDGINEIVAYSKELILTLDAFRGVIDSIPALQKALSGVEKTFIKIEMKMNDDELIYNLNKNFMAEVNTCLSLLKETLININTEANLFSSHRSDSFTDTVWNLFNQGQVATRFANYTKQLGDLCDHLGVSFLPILNTIVTESFEREKITQRIRSLSPHDKEKIRSLLFSDNYIVKLYIPKPVEGEETGDHRHLERRLSQGSATAFDLVHDYYHLKWLQVLPHIWQSYPELTMGQVKYIYLTHSFFRYYQDDYNFINEKTVEEAGRLQLYLEMVEEIPIFKTPDYEFVAQAIHENKDLTMRGLIDKLNERFVEKREFNFLLLLSCELFSTKSLLYEEILSKAIHEFPSEESQWPEGDFNLDWKVIHVIHRNLAAHEKSQAK